MLKPFTKVTVSLISAVATSVATLPTPSFASSARQSFLVIPEELVKPQETAIKEVAPEKPKEKRFICKQCNEYEKFTLEFLQKSGIRDRNALATIMGNIRQESTFIPNICEGGARIPYHQCRSGGVGILQWTNASRYYGLGKFATRIGGDPSTLHTQLKYMMYENDWKMIEPHMKLSGKSIDYYMYYAHKWIRWGHHGARTNYAHEYARRLISIAV
jgi:hypothetical protein